MQPPSNPHSNGRYVAGSTLKGTVYVQCNDDVDANDLILQLRFKGNEITSVRYHDTVHDTDGDGNDITRQIPRDAHGKRNIIEMELPITQEGGGVINAGSYSYPFEFQLPLSLPSSMEMTSYAYRSGSCEIKYKVKAELKGANSWRGMKEEVEVPIMATPPSSDSVGYFVQPTTQAITTCCCFNRGDVTFGANVDDTRVGCGESIKVDFGCKNETGVEIQHVDATVRQHVEWHADYHSNETTDDIAKRQFMQTMDMAARSKDELQQMNEDNAFQSRSIDDLFREIRQMVHDGTNSVSLDIPHGGTVCDSYHGALIRVTHTLCITIQTPGMSSNPSVEIPLQIVTPASVQVNEDEQPEEGEYDVPAPTLDGWDAENVTTVSPIYTPSNPILGGHATSGAEDEAEITVNPLIQEMGGDEGPSLSHLLKKLDQSFNAKSTIKTLLEDSEWGDIFAALAPKDYAGIIQRIKVEFDQTEVAQMVAEAVEGFTCTHVVAAYEVVVEWTREQLVRKLLPHCTDIMENANLILDRLSDWERVCLERDFEQARSD